LCRSWEILRPDLIPHLIPHLIRPCLDIASKRWVLLTEHSIKKEPFASREDAYKVLDDQVWDEVHSTISKLKTIRRGHSASYPH
jgi:hypothetical protein